MLKLKVQREYVFHYEDKEEDVQASFHFKFPFVEDRNYGSVKKLMAGKLTKDEQANKQAIMDIAQNAQYTMMRESLVKWEGVANEEGEPLKVHNEDGLIHVLNQKVVFEFLRYEPDLWDKIEKAFGGVHAKN